MDASDKPTDPELLYRLRAEYAHALQHEDYGHINRVIIPQFLESFGKYYEVYAQDWKSLSLSRPHIRVVIDPGEGEEIKMEWAGLVLTGQIELGI